MSENSEQDEKQLSALKSEEAMIEGILEGSPDAVGVAVVRYKCGCRKMAAVDKKGEAASKVIMYRDQAESICEQCKKDNGAPYRMTVCFMHWTGEALDARTRAEIEEKVLGIRTQ